MSDSTQTVALIGIGSNSARLLVARRQDSGHVSVVERGEVVTRLAGYKTMADGRLMLTPEAIRDTLEAAAGFGAKVREHGATLGGVIGTEALRSSSNGSELTDALERDLGVPVTAISGEEEARLGWLAIASSPQADIGDSAQTPLGVIDIGGGSTDLSVGYSGQPQPESVLSIDMGGRTAMRRFGLHRPIERTTLMGAVSALTIELARRASSLRPSPQAAIVIGGTASVLATLYRRSMGNELGDGETPITAAWLDRQLKDLSLLDQEGRVASGVPADRADVIVAGGAILLTLLHAWGLAECRASERNILDGYLSVASVVDY